MVIVEVPELRVMPVLVATVKSTPSTVKVLDPMFKARVLLLVDKKLRVSVTLKLLVVNVPCVRLKLLPEYASARSTVIPDPLVITAPRVLPAQVIVPLAKKSPAREV